MMNKPPERHDIHAPAAPVAPNVPLPRESAWRNLVNWLAKNPARKP